MSKRPLNNLELEILNELNVSVPSFSFENGYPRRNTSPGMMDIKGKPAPDFSGTVSQYNLKRDAEAEPPQPQVFPFPLDSIFQELADLWIGVENTKSKINVALQYNKVINEDQKKNLKAIQKNLDKMKKYIEQQTHKFEDLMIKA